MRSVGVALRIYFSLSTLDIDQFVKHDFLVALSSAWLAYVVLARLSSDISVSGPMDLAS